MMWKQLQQKCHKWEKYKWLHLDSGNHHNFIRHATNHSDIHFFRFFFLDCGSLWAKWDFIPDKLWFHIARVRCACVCVFSNKIIKKRNSTLTSNGCFFFLLMFCWSGRSTNGTDHAIASCVCMRLFIQRLWNSTTTKKSHTHTDERKVVITKATKVVVQRTFYYATPSTFG